MAELVYILSATTSIVCAFLLIKRYRLTHNRLLLWTCLSFIGFAVNNIILFFDTIVFPDVQFHGVMWRNIVGAISGVVLLIGLILEIA